jgi:hypothetical protein
MAMEKFRTRLFLTSSLTVSGATAINGVMTIAPTGRVILPYDTAAPTLASNGMIAVSHVGGTAKLLIKSGGSLFTLALPTAVAAGTITVTSA